MGSREDVASRIEADTKAKIDEMTTQVNAHKEHVSTIIISSQRLSELIAVLIAVILIQVITKILELVYDIKPELHKNFKAIK